MNRPVTETTPDGKVRTYEYNKAGLLERVLLDEIEYVRSVEYNEKGQRTDIYFGNNSKTRYYYDPKNFRLTRLLTTRNNGTVILQDLNYTYDPEGNIVEQTDDAVQTEIYGNTIISPTGKYEYDALYRIVKAEGREQLDLAMATEVDFLPTGNDMQNYTQLYSYDELGNMESVNSQGRWTRSYEYDTHTNRLLNTGQGFNYTYDAQGNMVSMPHLDNMEWDYKGNLIKTVGGNITTYYRYDSNGNRVRKIAHKVGAITEERIYIGNYELYRKKVNGTLDTERETAFVSDDTKRIAIVDTLLSPLEITVRYQYDNHLGSACLELDSSAQVISYEEYHPFGSTSYRAGRNATETSLKRYRYVGKERDEETGLYYYGARYYAAWLCRFVSVDPLQFKYPHYTPYQYAGNKPISYIDLDGLEEMKPTVNPIHVYYSTSLTGKQSDSVMAQYVTATNRKGANVSIEIAGSISPLLDLIFDFNSAITEKEVTPLAQDATEGVMKAGSYIMKKASEDNMVGQNKGLLKSYSKNLSIGGKILSKVFSAYNISKEVNSLPTKQETIADLTFSVIEETKYGKVDIVNEGVLHLNKDFNNQISSAIEIIDKTYKAVDIFLTAFDFEDPDQIRFMKTLIERNAKNILKDAVKL